MDSSSIPRVELIQRIGDVEMPATGRWAVLPNQPLALRKRSWRRTTASSLRTLTGRLDVGERLTDASLELSARCTRDPRLMWRFQGRLAIANRLGRWQFLGDAELSLTESWPDMRIDIAYHGVFCAGARPVAWITLTAPDSCPRGIAHVVGDLNLSGPGPATEQRPLGEFDPFG